MLQCKRFICLVAAVFAFLASAQAQSTYSDVHVVNIHARDASTDFEVEFDAPVCAMRTPAARAQAIRSLSVNHGILFSMAMAAFLSNLFVRVQTSDDARCHIQSFEVRR